MELFKVIREGRLFMERTRRGLSFAFALGTCRQTQ